MAIVRPLDGPERREWESYRPLERRWLGVLMCASIALAATPRAEAGYLLKFTGNSRLENRGVLDGTWSFAVLDRLTGYSNPAANDTFGTGVNGFDLPIYTDETTLNTAARYLYMYEISNDGPNTTAIAEGLLGPLNPFTATPFFRVGQFTDATGPVTAQPLPNGDPLGPNVPYSGKSTGPHLITGAEEPPGVNRNPVGVVPETLGGVKGPFLDSLFLVVPFQGSPTPGTQLASGNSSVLFGLTSDLPPAFVPSAFFGYNGEQVGFFSAVAPVPEPSSWVLMGIAGVAGLALGARHRRLP